MSFYSAPPFRSTSAISQSALLSFISSSMPLIALLLGIRPPSGRRTGTVALTAANDVSVEYVHENTSFGFVGEIDINALLADSRCVKRKALGSQSFKTIAEL
jgi:hypothetical protein